MRKLASAARGYFTHWFHPRNIIIVSEHKVKHIPIGGVAQFGVLSVLALGVCWASYSTGSFMAARSALKEKNQTLRSVANARIETNFSPVFKVQPTAEAAAEVAQREPGAAALNDPMYTLAAVDPNRLFARIAMLESKVAELKNSNQAIIQRVSDKTSGRIDDLETIIKQTGLRPEELQKQAPHGVNQAARAGEPAKPSGGPFIPAEPLSITPDETQLYRNLDRLSVLRQIVGNLPLATPMANGAEESQFGHRVDPINGHLAFHSGLDLSGPAGSRINSTADGKVVFAGLSSGYGNVVDIDHGFGLVTRYGHLSSISVKDGQKVRKGDAIGIQGSTGRSTGAHLHYEVRYHGQPMNPSKFLSAGNYVSQD